jgi:hypothetical protein
MEIKTDKIIQLIKRAQELYSEEYLVVGIPTFLSKKFIAYCSMKVELELAMEYLKILKTKPDKTVQSALTYSLISLYGKCFTDASKHSNPKLEPNDLFRNKEEHLATHAFLMDIRHQFIAHRGESESETGISYMLVKKDNVEERHVRISLLKQTSFSNEELDRFEVLISFILECLKDKIQVSGQKVYEGFLKLFTAEQLAKMIVNGVVDKVYD